MERWQPPTEQVVEAPKPPRWPMVLLLLALLAVTVAGLWVIRRQMHPIPRTTEFSTAAAVRSDIAPAGDSLQVVVTWRLTEDPAGGLADSIRVEVGLGNGGEWRTHVIPGSGRADTLWVPAPAPGETVAGYSCVATVHGPRLSRETCTPWQYVRPAAQVPPAPSVEDTVALAPRKSARAAEQARVVRIVVEPSGQQIDPDVGGRCAAWQRRNPTRSMWIEVNQEAVPECMGPNGKPTVAQFCAFAVLADGRRVETANSAGNAYCDRLYQAWVRERTI
jgi:hypothetical protein